MTEVTDGLDAWRIRLLMCIEAIRPKRPVPPSVYSPSSDGGEANVIRVGAVSSFFLQPGRAPMKNGPERPLESWRRAAIRWPCGAG